CHFHFQGSKKTFKKTFQEGRENRTMGLNQLWDMSCKQVIQLHTKEEAPPMEKPQVLTTHLCGAIILPKRVGSMVGAYNSKTFNQVEIKPEMTGHYLGEFSITCKPVKQGRSFVLPQKVCRFFDNVNYLPARESRVV
uniref:40S ribosomal protein S15 n=1 Tax=Sus scrofa TaxID=9823 RepID=A0A8D1F2M0_PIG